MPTPAELALSHTDLKPEELEHLQRLLGSWSVLADLSFSDLLLLVPVHATGLDGKGGAGAVEAAGADPAGRGSRAGRARPDATQQPAHPGRPGPGGPDRERVAVDAGGPVPPFGRDRAGQHPPPDSGRAGAGGEHPRSVRRPHHRGPPARLAGAAQGADQHVRADLPRRVRAPGRHGGPIGLPVPRRGRRHGGVAPGGRRCRRGRRRRAGGVRLAQRHERVPPHGHLHPARGAPLRGPRR